MKTQLLLLGLFFATISGLYAQAGATVYAKNSDISDNLDLRAVSSIFGESRDLEDFEYRLNEPKYQISNLDLNYDNQVDYLRVIETVEDRTHVIIIQAVLDRDVYQDVATIEVERNNYNNVNIQVVGNDYLYGPNYIYEPVYVTTPVIYASFWVNHYRPYYSVWNWNYYPSFYIAWRPFPVYRYRSHVNICINVHNTYNYVNVRRSNIAVGVYSTRRSNGYERLHPNNSFINRNMNVHNRYELEQRRSVTVGNRRNDNSNHYSNPTNSKNYADNRINRGYNTRPNNSNASQSRNTEFSRKNNSDRNAVASQPNQNNNTYKTEDRRNNDARQKEATNYNASRTNSNSTVNTSRNTQTPSARQETQRSSSNRTVSNTTQNREKQPSTNTTNRRG